MLNDSDLSLEALHFERYGHEKEERYLSDIRRIIGDDLSEPYSVYVYRYFLNEWKDLCFLTLDSKDDVIGVVVCKLEPHRDVPLRGYIAMLVVLPPWRGKGIATKLVRMAIDAMIVKGADEICLETEITNVAALKLYEGLGFLRTKRLHRYYLNGNSAFRLVLPLTKRSVFRQDFDTEASEYH